MLLFLFYMELGFGAFFAVIALPLILEKIGPNPFYGFKTKKTFSNKEIWYKANKYLGKTLLAAGLVVMVLSAVLLIIGQNFDEILITVSFSITFFVPLIISMILSFIYLGKL